MVANLYKNDSKYDIRGKAHHLNVSLTFFFSMRKNLIFIV